MKAREELIALLERLPEELQEEVADFARFLLSKAEARERTWTRFSLESALRDLPPESYTEADLKERW